MSDFVVTLIGLPWLKLYGFFAESRTPTCGPGNGIPVEMTVSCQWNVNFHTKGGKS